MPLVCNELRLQFCKRGMLACNLGCSSCVKQGCTSYHQNADNHYLGSGGKDTRKFRRKYSSSGNVYIGCRRRRETGREGSALRLARAHAARAPERRLVTVLATKTTARWVKVPNLVIVRVGRVGAAGPAARARALDPAAPSKTFEPALEVPLVWMKSVHGGLSRLHRPRPPGAFSKQARQSAEAA